MVILPDLKTQDVRAEAGRRRAVRGAGPVRRAGHLPGHVERQGRHPPGWPDHHRPGGAVFPRVPRRHAQPGPAGTVVGLTRPKTGCRRRERRGRTAAGCLYPQSAGDARLARAVAGAAGDARPCSSRWMWPCAACTSPGATWPRPGPGIGARGGLARMAPRPSGGPRRLETLFQARNRARARNAPPPPAEGGKEDLPARPVSAAIDFTGPGETRGPGRTLPTRMPWPACARPKNAPGSARGAERRVLRVYIVDHIGIPHG